MKLIRITKLKESDNPLYPGNISEGFNKKCLWEENLPKVGECFDVIGFHTSVVQEIIDDNTFRTFNSIYRWEELEEVV